MKRRTFLSQAAASGLAAAVAPGIASVPDKPRPRGNKTSRVSTDRRRTRRTIFAAIKANGYLRSRSDRARPEDRPGDEGTSRANGTCNGKSQNYSRSR